MLAASSALLTSNWQRNIDTTSGTEFAGCLLLDSATFETVLVKESDEHLSPSHHAVLQLSFYKSDKGTTLGENETATRLSIKSARKVTLVHSQCM